MKPALVLLIIAAAFAVAATVTVRVNRQAYFVPSEAVQAELAGLLQQNGLAPQPMGDPPGNIIDHALRFSQPGCPVDGFLLPMADTLLADVQAIRFTELTGAAYSTTTLSMASQHNIVERRAARAVAALKSAFGFAKTRNTDAVLALFTAEDCEAPTPDMRAFWAPAQTQG
jgi:hypothetical protein